MGVMGTAGWRAVAVVAAGAAALGVRRGEVGERRHGDAPAPGDAAPVKPEGPWSQSGEAAATLVTPLAVAVTAGGGAPQGDCCRGKETIGWRARQKGWN